jgi:hypothetical protein
MITLLSLRPASQKEASSLTKKARKELKNIWSE